MMNSDAASDGSDNVSRFSALGNLTYLFNVSDLEAILLGETAFFLGVSWFVPGGWSVPTNLYSPEKLFDLHVVPAVSNDIKSSSLVIVDIFQKAKRVLLCFPSFCCWGDLFSLKLVFDLFSTSSTPTFSQFCNKYEEMCI